MLVIKSLSLKISASLILAGLLIFTAMILYNYVISYKLPSGNVEEDAWLNYTCLPSYEWSKEEKNNG